MNTNSNRRKSAMDATRLRITQMEQEREERRRSMIQRKEARKQEQLKNIAAGNPGDVDFIGMVEAWRQEQAKDYRPPKPSTLVSNICIAVRKRPMSDKERDKLDHDSVSCFPPQVTIHSAKFKVDGITKYLTHNSFQFDHAFGEDATTEDIYVQTTLPLVDHVVSTHGRATVFCYGQTGSGKTFTMNGIQQILAYDLYAQIKGYETNVAFFELYGGFIQDLLNDRQRCKLLEDGKGEVNITGLIEVPARSPEEFLEVVNQGNRYEWDGQVVVLCSHSCSNDLCCCSLSTCSAFVPLIPQRPMTLPHDHMPFAKYS
jgi:kinesin family protein 2/24